MLVRLRRPDGINLGHCPGRQLDPHVHEARLRDLEHGRRVRHVRQELGRERPQMSQLGLGIAVIGMPMRCLPRLEVLCRIHHSIPEDRPELATRPEDVGDAAIFVGDRGLSGERRRPPTSPGHAVSNDLLDASIPPLAGEGIASWTGPRFLTWSMCFRTSLAKWLPNVAGPLSKGGAGSERPPPGSGPGTGGAASSSGGPSPGSGWSDAASRASTSFPSLTHRPPPHGRLQLPRSDVESPAQAIRRPRHGNIVRAVHERDDNGDLKRSEVRPECHRSRPASDRSASGAGSVRRSAGPGPGVPAGRPPRPVPARSRRADRTERANGPDHLTVRVI